jgi:4-amino-4-deoxy-L-arabinose transferase-like glycosyltransferase
MRQSSVSPATISVCGAAVVFIVLQLIIIARTRIIYWDEAVFLSMGKYLATGGSTGLWETLRPPLLPVVVSVFYPTGVAVVFVKLLCVLLAATAGILFYDILRRVVREEIAAAAAIVLLFTQIWFAYANLVLTDVLSVSIVIIAAWSYVRGYYVWTGVAAATAFLVRFPSGLFLFAVGIVELILLVQKKSTWLRALRIGCGFAFPVLLWLGLNWWLWHAPTIPWYYSAFRPLIDGFHTAATENVGIYYTQPGFYIRYALIKLPIVLFALVGLWHIRTWRAAAPLCVLALCALMFFEWLPNDQLRFFALILPGLLALTALGVAALFRYPVVRWVAVSLSVATLVLALANAGGLVLQSRALPESTHTYYTYLNTHPVTGSVLITNPLAAWYLDYPVTPVYFGLFTQAEDAIRDGGAVLLETDNVACGTPACARAVSRNVALVESLYDPVLVEHVGTSTYTVYVRSTD